MTTPQKVVAVTGASGFIASHLVRLLLEKGYKVHGTVRNPKKASKVQHLLNLPNAQDNLVLFKADLNDSSSFAPALAGTEAVFHVASPFFFSNITDPESQMLRPAVTGTENVLKAVAADAGKTIQTVVVTSSAAAVQYDSGKPDEYVYSEKDWSDEEWLKSQKLFYHLSKTLAERAAWKWEESIGKQLGIRMVAVNPTLVIGPLLQKELNTSSEMILQYISGTAKDILQEAFGFTDVRDVVEIHLKAYENPNASGRYLVTKEILPWENVVEKLRRMRPNAPIPRKLGEGGPPHVLKFTCAKAVELLGRPLRTVDESLKDTVESLEKHGFVRQER